MTVAETQAFYGRWARAYDWLCRLLPGLGGIRERAVDVLDLSPGDTVADLGCGTGANLPHLRERVGPSGTVVGVDLTPDMLAQARQRVDNAGWQNVHLVQGDAARPPVSEVDAVLGTFVVGMLEDPAAGMLAWTNALESAAGGRIVVLEATRSNHSVAGSLNRAFDAFVAAGAPDKRGSDTGASRTLGARVDVARDALASTGELTRAERHVAGFVRLYVARPDGDA